MDLFIILKFFKNTGFYKIFNLEKNNDEIQQILGAIDSNGNGSINYMGMNNFEKKLFNLKFKIQNFSL